MPRIALVTNPRAGRGKVAKQLPTLLESLDRAGVDSTVFETSAPGHAVDLARQAAKEGFETVVAVGGDGTVNEVVNGLISNDAPVGTAALGVVAAGSGADFSRTYDLPGRVGDSLRGVIGPTNPLDVGKVVCRDSAGNEVVRYFVNVAEAGMAAATVGLAERLPRWFGRSRYLVAFWPTLMRFRPVEARIAIGSEVFEGVTHNVVIANARWFGGGMHISPHSDPSDGLADLQISIGPKRQAFTLVPRIYKGTHLPDDRILQMSGSAGSIETERPVPVEVDGEPIGWTPMRFEILRGLLRIHGEIAR